jgi:hypothetical protein
MEEKIELYGPTEELPNCTTEGVSKDWLKPTDEPKEEPKVEPVVSTIPKAVYV